MVNFHHHYLPKLTSNSLIFSSAILCFSKSWLWITPLDWRINLQVKKKRQITVGYLLHLLYPYLHTVKLQWPLPNIHPQPTPSRGRRNCSKSSHKPPASKSCSRISPIIWEEENGCTHIQCPWMVWKQSLHTASKGSLSSHSLQRDLNQLMAHSQGSLFGGGKAIHYHASAHKQNKAAQ